MDVIFYPLDIVHNKRLDNCIDIYGTTNLGKTLCLHVIGFPDYFRVKKANLTPKSIERTLINKNIAVVRPVTEVWKRSLYFYNDEVEPMYEIKLVYPSQRQAAIESLKDQTEFFDSWQRKYQEKFCTDLRVNPSTWTGARDVTLSPGDVTRCDLEGTITEPTANTFYTLDDEETPINQIIIGFDLECSNLRSDIQMPQAAFDPIIQISVAVAHLLPAFDVKAKTVFCFKQTGPVDGVTIKSFDSERDMICAFLDYVKSVNPDVVSGYNINGFDIPFLWTRCEINALDVGLAFSKNAEHKASLMRWHNQTYQIQSPGILMCDCMLLVKYFLQIKLDSYTLDFVAKSLLKGQKKDEMAYEAIPRIFRNGDPSELAQLAKYCMNDTMLVMDILKATDGVYNLNQEAAIVGLDRTEVLRHSQQKMCVSTICTQIRDDGGLYAIPADVTAHTKTEKYTGAVVLEPHLGMYNYNVAVLDFASMYPSIICAYNLCYSTMVTEEYITRNGLVEGEDYTRAPGILSGLFLTVKHRKSLLAHILERLKMHRNVAKKKMAESEPESIPYILADCKQGAYKRTANSMYGLCGAHQNPLLPCINIAASVTAYGRSLLSQIKNIAEDMIRPENGYPCRAKVIYGDTDSIFVALPDTSLTEAMKISSQAADKITEVLAAPPVKLEFEKVFSCMILANKKNYVGLMHTLGKNGGKLLMRGLSVVKRDQPKLLRETMSKAIHLTIVDSNWPKAAELIKSTTRAIAYDGGQCKPPYNVWDFATTMAITKPEEEYQANRSLPGHYTVAKMMWKRNDPEAPAIGDRVYSVVCRGSSSKVTERFRHPKDVEKDPNLFLDAEYYIARMQKAVMSCFRYIYPTIHDLNKDLFPVHITKPIGRFVAPISIDQMLITDKFTRKRKNEKTRNEEPATKQQQQQHQTLLLQYLH